MTSLTPPSSFKNFKRKLPRWLDALLSSPGGMTGTIIIFVVVIMAVFAPLIAPYDPNSLMSAIAWSRLR